ncbi:CASP8 and FADD-like apoptosis regulator [Syngnathoides biaculeatus]|uniref:CASP8 and FADD-like apoptosis regulator n=1 Tax=Syngnathoides biaculeatus TaxID=300417 RepID=UPI002ADD46A8|nr:CASP8 and FADD-like apoptosis regulator [Syngnathoides biaculeatus]
MSSSVESSVQPAGVFFGYRQAIHPCLFFFFYYLSFNSRSLLLVSGCGTWIKALKAMNGIGARGPRCCVPFPGEQEERQWDLHWWREHIHEPWERLQLLRVLMAHISEDMAKDDVSSVKFLLAHMLLREKMETAKDFLDLIVELEHMGKVFPTRVDLLEECLVDVGRVDLAKKLKVSVNAPAVPEEVVHHTCQESPVSRYKFASDPRGECVIIDCVENDGEMMAHAFKSLHFNVTLHKWLNLVETVSTLRKVFQRSPDRSGDGFVCCIISRAMDNRLQATDVNCEGLRLEDVRRFFNGDACPALVGKPKLFFI